MNFMMSFWYAWYYLQSFYDSRLHTPTFIYKFKNELFHYYFEKNVILRCMNKHEFYWLKKWIVKQTIEYKQKLTFCEHGIELNFHFWMKLIIYSFSSWITMSSNYCNFKAVIQYVLIFDILKTNIVNLSVSIVDVTNECSSICITVVIFLVIFP